VTGTPPLCLLPPPVFRRRPPYRVPRKHRLLNRSDRWGRPPRLRRHVLRKRSC
jgi:hypothetical protein